MSFEVMTIFALYLTNIYSYNLDLNGYRQSVNFAVGAFGIFGLMVGLPLNTEQVYNSNGLYQKHHIHSIPYTQYPNFVPIPQSKAGSYVRKLSLHDLAHFA